MAELALEDDQRHAFASHLDGVGTPKLVRRKASTYSPEMAVRRSGGAAGPVSAPRRTGDDPEQWPDESSIRSSSQGEVPPSPIRRCRPRGDVRPCRVGRAASRGGDRDRLWRGGCLLGPQSGAPEVHDQARGRQLCARSPAARQTALTPSPIGESAGSAAPVLRGRPRAWKPGTAAGAVAPSRVRHEVGSKRGTGQASATSNRLLPRSGAAARGAGDTRGSPLPSQGPTASDPACDVRSSPGFKHSASFEADRS